MLPDINFTLAQGGLNGQLPGTDYYSGMPIWCADNALPSGFSTTDRIKRVSQIQDAEALGIKNDFSDETQATASYLVTGAGASGDVVNIKVVEPDGKVVTIGVYKRASGDTTAALVAAGIRASVNALTSSTGYSATLSTATVTIKARKGLGVFLNSGTPLSVVITGTITGTITQFTGGVASQQAVWYYHIDRFFKRQTNAQGVLYLYFNTTPSGTPDFEEIMTLQTFTNGLIKQMAVNVDFTTYSSTHFSAIQAKVTEAEAAHMPIDVVVYTADMTGMTASGISLDLGSLPNKNLCVSIGQDGAAQGKLLSQITGKSTGCMGAVLGTIASSTVSQSIAEVGAFNISDGTEYDTAALATGELIRNISLSTQNQLHDWGYIFLRKYVGSVTITGTYFNSSRTAINLTSDYSYIERNRTINKMIRGSREKMLPLLSARIRLNSNGTLSVGDIANFQARIGEHLSQMTSDGDLSGDSTDKGYAVNINPAQNVLSTGEIFITETAIPVAIGRKISIKIGFVPKI